mmetsp:Transcript_7711/g.21939  ORF Transcript_7711/g.21939 Transcript_7711/m.21939 type:complete len:115 (-) Transcript_7711:163-507(-)
MCRKLSGTAFQSWVPIQDAQLTWTACSTLGLQRTSGWASRHTCNRCGSTLSIVYDSQPGTTWLAAGSYDDVSVRSVKGDGVSAHLSRVLHICELSLPVWFDIPQDGLPRIPYAG